jgi:hypothetical protein
VIVIVVPAAAPTRGDLGWSWNEKAVGTVSTTWDDGGKVTLALFTWSFCTVNPVSVCPVVESRLVTTVNVKLAGAVGNALIATEAVFVNLTVRSTPVLTTAFP